MSDKNNRIVFLIGGFAVSCLLLLKPQEIMSQSTFNGKESQNVLTDATNYPHFNVMNVDGHIPDLGDSSDNPVFFPRNTIFIELLGSGGLFSLNYERLVFSKNKDALTARIGGAFLPVPGGHWILFPTLLNYQRAFSSRVSFEAGIGGTYIHTVHYQGSSTRKGDLLYICGTVGFRILVARHFLIKAAFTPTIDRQLYYPFTLSGGLSLGYSFGLPQQFWNRSTRKIYAEGDYYTPKNSIFLEAFGSGHYYSLNYERVTFRVNRHSINSTAGYSVVSFRHSSLHHIIPVFANYQFKISPITSLEAGIGLRGVLSKKDTLFYTSFRGVDLLGNVGFKFFLTKNLYLKVGVKPLLINNSKFFSTKLLGDYLLHSFSLNLGYCWNKCKRQIRK